LGISASTYNHYKHKGPIEMLLMVCQVTELDLERLLKRDTNTASVTHARTKPSCERVIAIVNYILYNDGEVNLINVEYELTFILFFL